MTDVPAAASSAHVRRATTRAVAVAVAVLLAVLTACSSSDSGDPPVGSRGRASHNSADVAFARGTIPHHAQAVEMADLALAQARSADVLELANQIKAAQQPEIDTMSGWLRDWDVPVPTSSDMAGMNRMDAMPGMAGMMSQADMKRLRAAAGRRFDTLWLTMMVTHHEGAVEMARAELTDGEYDDAQTLATDIIDAQQDEISTMNQLLHASSN